MNEDVEKLTNRFRIGKTRYFLFVTGSGYELKYFTGKDDNGKPKFKFIGHYGVYKSFLNGLIRHLMSDLKYQKVNKNPNLKDLEKCYKQALKLAKSIDIGENI